MKPFLVLQLRNNDQASDNEFEAILRFGQLSPDEVHRIRMEQSGIPLLSLGDYAGVIVGGGASNVSDGEKDKPSNQKRFEKDLDGLLDEIVEHDIPYLGACYGFGALAQHQNGIVAKGKYAESVGAVTITLSENAKSDPITKTLPKQFKAFVGHKEACQKLPKHAVLLASSEDCPYQMFRMKSNIYATQFHPELDTDGLILRINIYQNDGYFPADELESLSQKLRQEDVRVPPKILQNFVNRYRYDARPTNM